MPAWVRPPGTTYTSSESFNSLGWYEEPGAWRFGIDFEGNSTGRPYPYRFAIGSDAALTVINGEKYLMPGQRATIVGHLQIIDKPPRIALHYWAGCFLGRRMWRSKPNLLLRRAAVVAAPPLREAGGAAEQRHRDATDSSVHHKKGGTQ
jgi:hypothetical protein